MLRVTARNVVSKGKVGEFLETVKPLIEATRKEEGCMQYELHRDLGNENILTFLEIWESKERLDAHMETSHFKEAIPKLGALCDEEIDVNVYTLVL